MKNPLLGLSQKPNQKRPFLRFLVALFTIIFFIPSPLYAPKAQECTLLSLSADVQSVINSLNIILPKTIIIQNIVTMILIEIGNLSVNDQLILSQLDVIESLIENLNISAIPCTVSGLDEIERLISIGDAQILSAIDNISVSVSLPDSCCSALENLISKDDAQILSKLDTISSQIENINITVNVSALPCTVSGLDEIERLISIGDAQILSAIDNISVSVSVPDSCCSALENLISRDDAYLSTKIDTISNQISISDMQILSAIENISLLVCISMPDLCCSALENLISRDDAQILSKLDTISSQIENINITVNVSALPCTVSGLDEIERLISIGDAQILSAIDNISVSVSVPDSCCSVLENLISKDDAYLSTKIDMISSQISISDMQILSAIENISLLVCISIPDLCCSALESLISQDDAYLATKIDTIISQLSITEQDIFSKIDDSSCCLSSQIDNFSNQISVLEQNIFSKIDDSSCCLSSQIDNFSSQISVLEQDIFSKIDDSSCCLSSQLDILVSQLSIVDTGACCSVLEHLISQDDAYLSTKIDTVSNQISVGDALILSALDMVLSQSSCCAEIPITTSTTLVNAGIYCLCNNVATIDIYNTDIAVDLNGHVVTNGITVHSHNITIKNGTVHNPSGDAITVMGGSNITISRVRVESAFARGINLIGVTGGLVEYCELVQNTTGLELNSSFGIEVNNTVARNNTISGFSLVSSATNTIRECRAINSGQGNTQTTKNSVYGFVAQNSSSNIFENCIANATQALFTTDYNSIVAGFALEGTSNCNKILGCEASNAITNATGFTVPYGIFLQAQFEGFMSVTVFDPGNYYYDNVKVTAWSPDGRYFAVGGSLENNDLVIYRFNRKYQTFTQVDVVSPGRNTSTGIVQAVQWSPDGMYLAVGYELIAARNTMANNGLYIYNFDTITETLTQVDSAIYVSGSVNSIAWSPTEKYLAVGGSFNTPVLLYLFNRVTQKITQVSTIATGGISDVVNSVSWLPGGLYLAVGGTLAGTQLRVYRFDETDRIFIQTDQKAFVDGHVTPAVQAVTWSPDGNYLAIGGQFTGPTAQVYVYQLNPVTGMLAQVATANPGGVNNSTVYSLAWCPNTRYLLVGAQLPNAPDLYLYTFDPSAAIPLVGFPMSPGPDSGTVYSVAWSPDGIYCSAGGAFSESPTYTNSLYIFRVLSFPFENVISDNVVYCNSGNQLTRGVGISGSSICNYIVGNTAYSNPINPPIVSTNYEFVCNVFHQLFGTGPTLLQNIALGTCEPIGIVDDLALLIKQTQAQINIISSQIDSLNISVLPCTVSGLDTLEKQISIGDALILSAIENINITVNVSALPCTVSGLDELERQISINDALILSKIDSTSCCSVLENLISKDDAQILSKLDAISSQIENINITVNVSALPCTVSGLDEIERQISIGDALILSKLDTLSVSVLPCTVSGLDEIERQISLGDALILSAIENIAFSVPDSCCSVLENLISRDDAYLATKVDILSNRVSVNDALILSAIENIAFSVPDSCCSVLENLISRDDAYLATKVDILSNRVSVNDALILSAIENIAFSVPDSCCSVLENLISRDDAYLATKVDILSNRVSVNDALILSAIENIAFSVPDSCCSVLENLISRDDAYLATKVDTLSNQVSIGDALILSAIENIAFSVPDSCCSVLENLISRDDAYLATKVDTLSNQVSIGDALILSAIENIAFSVPDSCCSVLENLISRDDAYLATKVDTLSNQVSIGDALILSAIENIAFSVPDSCCSVLENLISRDDAYLATKVDTLSNQVSVGDALILSAIDAASCCSVLENLISRDDAYLATKVDTLSNQVSVGDALILSAIDAASCCSVLENLISRDDAYLATKIDTVLSQISVIEKDIFSKIDAASCCSVLENLISRDDAYLATKVDALSNQVSVGDALILSAIENMAFSVPDSCCSVLENLISRDDAYLATKIDTVLSQISVIEKDIFSKIDAASCCSVLENLISRDDAYLATKVDTLSNQVSVGDALILSAIDAVSCCSVLENLISRDDAYLATKVDTLSLQVSINDAVILSALASPCAAIPITGNTVIITSGFYCLAVNGVTSIVVQASDVVVDLNNHVVAGTMTVNASQNVTIRDGVVRASSSLPSTSDAITVNGTTNITIANVRAENGQRGILLRGVQSGAVTHCEFTTNFTGIELDSSADITIEYSTAKRNMYSGFSLAASFTNSIRDCKAINSGQGNSQHDNNNIYGFVAQNSSSNIFENCIANATQALSTTDYNSIVAGFALTGTSNCNKIIGCEAANAITSASGFTVPYGIYLQGVLGEVLTATAVPAIPVPDASVNAVQWSPDRRFIAVGTSLADLYRVRIYAFDSTNAVLQQIAVPDQVPGDQVNTVDWSPDGKYLAVGMNQGSATDIYRIRIYSFDSTNNSLKQVAVPNPLPVIGLDVLSVRWSPDGKYLVAGTRNGSDIVDSLYVYNFDRVNNTLTLLSSAQPGFDVYAVDWSDDGRYIAVGLEGIVGVGLQVYLFTPNSPTLALIASASSVPFTILDVYSVRWSPDCSFIAIGGQIPPEVSAGYVAVYQFTPATTSGGSSVVLLQASQQLGHLVHSVDWSADGRYIVAGYDDSLVVLGYDRAAQRFTSAIIPNALPSDIVHSVDWSPDGQYIVVGTSSADQNEIYIYNALSFPYDNVITDNTVYCNSGAQCPNGVGICGSSICNYIVGNTAYSNPINPSMVSSNYQFVCNVFSQFFGDAPTLLQNIALGSCEPIAIPDNIALLVKQGTALLNSQMDSLSIQIAVGDAMILSAIDAASCCSALENLISVGDAQILSAIEELSSACIPITTATSISNPGTYCLQNEIAGNITISNRDIVLDLNGFKVDGSIIVNSHNITIKNGTVQNLSGDAIIVNEGTNITISHVRAESSAGRGINLIGVMGGLIEYCELVQNATGIELNGASEVEINNTVARRNLYSGFSLAASFTNSIRDCKAINSGQGNNQPDINNVYGFVAQNSSSNIFENCIANATQALSTTDYNSIVAGFALTGTSNYNKIIGCEAANAVTSAVGFTIPYGIYLQPQFDGLISVTAEQGSFTEVATSWSPDGIYLAAGGTSAINNVMVYQLSRTMQSLTSVEQLSVNGDVRAIEWSPDGQYLAVGASIGGLYVYQFDRATQTLTQVAQTILIVSHSAVAWSPNGQYLAVGTSSTGVYIYQFNRVTQALALVDTKLSGDTINGVSWSPDGQYLAVADATASVLDIYQFDRAAQMLRQSPSYISSVSQINVLTWSPDGQYVAVGSLTTSPANNLYIYRFNRTVPSLTEQNSFSVTSATSNVNALEWSPDGQYIAAGSSTISSISVYRFDRGAKVLMPLFTAPAPTAQTWSLAWSPDGQYLVDGVSSVSNLLTIYSALSFPYDNVIKDNIVYCNSGAQFPSGVGISGSSICNLIIQNTAYSNPTNPSIVSSNYQFSCNVFSQLFNAAPTLMQNIALGSCEPIAMQDDVGLLVKQAAAEILSALAAPCAAIPITGNTVITMSGFYCLANDLVSAITVQASDVVIDLNNHTVGAVNKDGGISADGYNNIAIKNGTVTATVAAIAISRASGITISDVITRDTIFGISFLQVQNGLIERCRMNSNITGLELVKSGNIEVNNSRAIDNVSVGFSLIQTFTSTIRNCQAINTGNDNPIVPPNNEGVFGFQLDSSSNNIVENCIANATQALSTTDYNFIVAGFAIAEFSPGVSNSNKIIGCEAANAVTNANSFTVPYGIWLQGKFGLSLTVTAVPAIPVPDASVNAVQWSPDRRFIAVGIGLADSYRVRIYAFDSTNAVLQQIAVPDQVPGDQVNTVDWSPDGKYLAVGMNQGGATDIYRIRIYSFDSTNNSLKQVAVPSPSLPLDGLNVNSVRWSPDGKYLAAGCVSGGASLFVYAFDRVNNVLTLLSSAQPAFDVSSVDWSGDGLYIAVGIEGIVGVGLQVYSFAPNSPTLALIASASSVPFTILDVYSVQWSPDCSFIAIGGQIPPESSVGYVAVYQFTPTTSGGSSVVLLQASQELGHLVHSVDWSADGRYIVAGYDDSLMALRYDRGGNLLTSAAIPDTPLSDTVNSVDWSPDGQYIVVGASSADPNRIYIYNALSFPSDNVIKDNTVYCNSGAECPNGVGICGSSICNYIVGNTAYSNPINPSMASSNYQFVCNVFNQFFGNAPTLLQNIALGSCEPIAIPDNVALLVKQGTALLNSQIDSLSVQVSIGDAVILSAIENASSSPCAAIPITSDTVIATSGFYCLANNLVNSIVVQADDVVIDLNNHVVGNISPQTAGIAINGFNNIRIQNGTVKATQQGILVGFASNITISDVVVQNSLAGIDFLFVQNALIKSCQMEGNEFGLHFLNTVNTEVNNSCAINNTYKGFDLQQSFTNTFRNCRAISTGQGNTDTVLTFSVCGFSIDDSSNNIFENCIVNATQALYATDYNSFVAGFALTNASNYNKIIGCEAANAMTSASGFTVPYGILLQGVLESPLTLTAVPPIPVPSGNIYAVQWSPDRRYIAVGSDAPDIRIYAFDSANAVLQQIAVADQEQGSLVGALDWSSDGKYLAVGMVDGVLFYMRIYAFDSTNNSLTQVVFLNQSLGMPSIFSVRWSPDGKYLAAASSDRTNSLLVYGFDRVNNTLTLLSTVSLGPFNVFAVDWSNDGLYIAVGLGLSSHKLEVYSFTPGNATLTLSASVPIVSAVNAVRWSPDCNFIAVGILGASQTLGVYTFTAATSASPALLTLKQSTSQALGNVLTVDWSSDGRYIVAGYNASPHLSVYGYDRSANSFTAPISPNINPLQQIECVDWSPDGQYIAAVSNISTSDPNKIYIYNALSFPSDNVIKDNTVYCNSGSQCPNGVGICGSSICNYIVGNTAYSNPINPSMASSNYQFVCNVFSQFFGNAPTLLQNIALGSCEPIAIPDNVALLVKQGTALLNSQIDSLSAQISIGDAVILSAIENISNSASSSPCAAIPIIADTTILNSGFYCLANNLVNSIVVQADDVVIDLNDHVVGAVSPVFNGITVSANNVTIQNGTVIGTFNGIYANSISNIKLLDIVATTMNSLSGVGISFSNVTNALVDHCQINDNASGLSIESGSGNIQIYNSIAMANSSFGFSLMSSSTNTIRGCQAINTGQGNSASFNNHVYGFVAQNSSSNIFENCIANATQALSTTDYNSIVAGFALEGSSNCNKIIGCEAANAITSASGFTVPYGILLQGVLENPLTLTAVPSIPVPDASVNAVQWSPDRRFIAVGTGLADSYRVRIYAFDSTNAVLQQIAVPDQVPGDQVNTVDWSPDGKYLAAGMNQGGATDIYRIRIYSFDSANNSLEQVAVPSPSLPLDGLNVNSVRWSPDGKYLAAGCVSGGASLFVYAFDRVNNVLTLLSSAQPAFDVSSVDWSGDGLYIAVGLEGIVGVGLQVYSFTPNSPTLALIASASSVPFTILDVYSVRWSPDCSFIAIGGQIPPESSVGYAAVYQFTPATTSSGSSVLLQASQELGHLVHSVDWSADGRYIVAGYDDSLTVLGYDRSGNLLTSATIPDTSPSDTVNSVDWSPDGQYIVVGASSADPNRIYIYNALSFPSDNVIKDNTVYCNSGAECPNGVGICGSSICNYIVGNTAYSNPINPSMASSNYQFVCNVFNQLFGDAPGMLQNVALGSCEPIAIPDDLALLQKQTLARIGLLTDGASCLPTLIDVPQDINDLNLNVIQLLKTILLELRGCGCTS